MRRHYAVKPWTEFVEIYWGEVGQAYVTPISQRELCIAFIVREKQSSLDEMIASIPALQTRLVGASVSSTQRGSLSLNRRLDRVTRGHVALIGDASGSVDAITGEGLALCFRQAVALADSITAGSLGKYEEAHPRIRKLPSFMSKTMLLMDRHPMLRRQAMHAFERSPQLFESMLRVHIGDLPLNWWGHSGILQIGVRLLSS
jgi:flavin-dependent dehydrogenase